MVQLLFPGKPGIHHSSRVNLKEEHYRWSIIIVYWYIMYYTTVLSVNILHKWIL